MYGHLICPDFRQRIILSWAILLARELHSGERGRIEATEPKALSKLGLNKNHWTTRVKGIGSSYWRVVGELEELIEKAKKISQRTLFGIGFVRILNKI